MTSHRPSFRGFALFAMAAIALACSSTQSPSAVSPTPTPTPAPTPVAPDQANLATPETSVGCGSPARDWGMLFQGFTPTKASLRRVVLRFRAGGSFPTVDVQSTITIRAASPHGTEIASAGGLVSGPRAVGEVVEVTFPFPRANVTPGQLYVIGWVQPHVGDEVLTWLVTPGNTYPRGQAYDCLGNALPGYDFVFATYAE